MRARLLLAVAVLMSTGACTGRTLAPTLPPARDAVVLDCDHVIGTEPPSERLAVVLDAVALPVGITLQAYDHGPWLFAKQGLVVRAGAVVELSLPAGGADWARLGWGNADQRGLTVRVPGCGGQGGWVAFAGGYYVDKPACLPIRVRTATREDTVHIGVGRACPQAGRT